MNISHFTVYSYQLFITIDSWYSCFTASANPAYKINFSEDEEETSFMEEEYASSNEELVEDEEHREEMATERKGKQPRMEQSSVTPDYLKVQGLLQNKIFH